MRKSAYIVLSIRDIRALLKAAQRDSKAEKGRIKASHTVVLYPTVSENPAHLGTDGELLITGVHAAINDLQDKVEVRVKNRHCVAASDL